MTRKRSPWRTVLVLGLALALVASVTAAPVAATDADTVGGDDGVSVAGDDGIGIGVADSNANGTSTVDAGTDGVRVEVGSSSTGVECEVNRSTSGNPCSTRSGSNASTPGDVPVDVASSATNSTPGLPGGTDIPGSGSLPADPAEPVGSAPDAPGGNGSLPGGGSLPADPSAPVGSIPDVPGGNSSLPGGGSLPSDPSAPVGGLPGGGNGSAPTNGTLPLTTDTTVKPGEGVYQASVKSETNQTVGTSVNCDLSAGWLRLCGVRNTVPVKASDLPKDQLPAIPGPVKDRAPVSYGLLFLVADTAVQEPSSAVYLAIGQAGQNTPEQSPINPANPPYNPNQPPINLADPNGSINPGVKRTGSGAPAQSGDWRAIRAVQANLNDDVGAFVVGGVVQQSGTRYAGAGVGGSDGQNEYRGAVEVADDGSLWIDKEGLVSGNATLTQDEQHGGFAVDLGGKRYGQSFGGGGGGGGGAPSAPSLPVDPSQPPSPPAGASE